MITAIMIRVLNTMNQLDMLICWWKKDYRVFAPKRFAGGGRFSDTDMIRYGEIDRADDIVFDEKSDQSFKEILTPVSQTLFFFTEDQTKEASQPAKGAVIFLRNCDLSGLKRLDEMYLHNGPADSYYSKLRENVKFVLMGCSHSFESCFCVSMGQDFIKWIDADSIVNIIMNTYDYVNQYIDPEAPGGKEHIGYIVDRTGFPEFKKWALKDVELPEIAEVYSPIYWQGVKY